MPVTDFGFVRKPQLIQRGCDWIRNLNTNLITGKPIMCETLMTMRSSSMLSCLSTRHISHLGQNHHIQAYHLKRAHPFNKACVHLSWRHLKIHSVATPPTSFRISNAPISSRISKTMTAPTFVQLMASVANGRSVYSGGLTHRNRSLENKLDYSQLIVCSTSINWNYSFSTKMCHSLDRVTRAYYG